MRTDVAQMLALSPGDLDPEQDLVAAGLDSIRLMSLADRWGVPFEDLARTPTLNAWTALRA